jgi:porphobilinogen synthase
MSIPMIRPRRLRNSEGIRKMVRETELNPADFVYPLFVVPGENTKCEITSLPGTCHLSVDMALQEAQEAYALGIPAVLIFGLPEYKDEQGSSAWDASSPVQQAIRLIKKELPDMTIISDVCLCQYTNHGHLQDPSDTFAGPRIAVLNRLPHGKAHNMLTHILPHRT